MKYRMQGNKLELIRHVINYKEGLTQRTYESASIDEKLEVIARLVKQGIDYTTEDISQPEYEWLDGMIFEDEKEVLPAAEMGEIKYKQSSPLDLEKTVAFLMLELAKLKVGAK